jgi:hypothetical protein
MKLQALLTAFTLAVSAPALAHSEKGPHGGRLAENNDFHVELVAKQTSVEVYLSDANEKAMTAAGYKGIAILTVGGKAQRIELTSAQDKLTGTSPVALPAQPKGVVQITKPDGKTSQVKF